MRNALVIATLALAAACGISEDRYWERLETTYCEEYDECHTGDAPCPFAQGNDRPDDLSCTFDEKKARECLKGEFVCNDEFGPGSEWIDSPEACDDVYSCNVADTADTAAE